MTWGAQVGNGATVQGVVHEHEDAVKGEGASDTRQEWEKWERNLVIQNAALYVLPPNPAHW